MIEIIPAIDIVNGKCVRLSQGDFTKCTTYDATPLDIAREMEVKGIKRVHLVDLDGAKAGKVVNIATLKEIATHTNLIIDFGGGIKTFEDAAAVFDAGATIINIGSLAAKQPDTIIQWFQLLGPEKILIGADVIDYKIAINGWQQITELDVFNFINAFYKEGINQFFCTDIEKDGMLQGSSVQLYIDILQKFPIINLTASGGITTLQDIETLERIGCSGAIIGKAWHEGLISISTINRN